VTESDKWGDRGKRERETVNWRSGNQPGDKQNKSVVDVKQLQETRERKEKTPLLPL
jgi:hypothetical protein